MKSIGAEKLCSCAVAFRHASNIVGYRIIYICKTLTLETNVCHPGVWFCSYFDLIHCQYDYNCVAIYFFGCVLSNLAKTFVRFIVWRYFVRIGPFAGRSASKCHKSPCTWCAPNINMGFSWMEFNYTRST